MCAVTVMTPGGAFKSLNPNPRHTRALAGSAGSRVGPAPRRGLTALNTAARVDVVGNADVDSARPVGKLFSGRMVSAAGCEPPLYPSFPCSVSTDHSLRLQRAMRHM